MTYVPHYRVSVLGRQGGAQGPEIFSWSFALVQLAGDGLLADLEPNDTVWDDVRDDVAAYWGSAGMNLYSHQVLERVKIAPIGADGRYTGLPAERLITTAGANASTQYKPYSVACAVTLKTAGDLGRIKGRFYLPAPANNPEVDGRWAQAVADGLETETQTFINNINNQPGIDVLDMRVGVASQGRRDKNGNIRVQPGNHVVTSVSVGRVPDTIRRRRNKLSEDHAYSAVS